MILGLNNVFAEVVTEKISENKKWVAQKIDNHNAWNTSSCSSSTLGNASLLEVYSEKTTSGAYGEPTVQVSVAKTSFKQEPLSGELLSNSGKKWSLTRASTPTDPNSYLFLVRVGERGDIIAAIRRDNTMSVRLRDAHNQVVLQLPFSLSGSSKTVDAQFLSCQLSMDSF